MNQALSDAGRRIIDAVIEAPVAWRSPGELAERLRWSLDRTLDEIAELDVAGWLEAWELVDGPVVTLSVAGSARCGVRLVEVGFDETPRWARPGDPDPPGLRSPGVFRGEPAAALGMLADARPSAEQAALQAEEAEGRAHAPTAAGRSGVPEAFPRPTLLIGGGLSPWPGPLQVGGSSCCPACRSGRLPALAYCLWCDRWGLDRDPTPARPVAADAPRRPAARPPAPATELPDAGRRAEIERRKRRQKRKERCKLQMAEFCAWSRRAARARPEAVAP